MKKIIFVFVLLAVINGPAVKAGVNEQILIDAAKSTIEKARKDGTGLSFSIKHDTEETVDKTNKTSTTADASIVSTLSNMRAQAELSYSNENSYGKTTSSCYEGMFGNSLKSSITALLKYTKNISCSVKTTSSSSNVKNYYNSINSSWVVTAKLPSGRYWCVDSIGNLKAVGALSAKGLLSCDNITKAKTISVKEKAMYNAEVVLFPKSGNEYNAIFTTNISNPTSSTKNEIILKDGVTYAYINSNIVKQLTLSELDKNKVLNKYLAIPNTTSPISTYFSITPKKINDYVNIFTNSVSTVTLAKVNTDGSKTYSVSAKYYDTVINNISEFLLVSSNSNVFEHLRDLNEKPLFYYVTIKDGIISSISINQTLSGKFIKDIYTLSGKNVVGGIPNISGTNIVSCKDIWLYSSETHNFCDPVSPEVMAGNAKKGEDAAITSYLSNMRAQAELFYSNTNDYGPSVTNCQSGIFSSTASGGLNGLVTSVKTKTSDLVCKSDSKSWFVSAKLNTGPWFCVDSTGIASEITSQKTMFDTNCK